ncbi:conjugal transfer protein TraF [Helicobacter cynogastricus]|uniref:conjugal transfer protein TraF n=1 Tax=Helicobacter cynogastricus TaxID=329937 RepID=UPI000CF1387D|nr:conjugal transfer protein TraF [Helicobacter cynogastricus]
MRSMRLLGLCAWLCSDLGALEFGQMGNTSFGMGGAGVALEDSAWGLYYNPALLDVDARSKLGYSFGADIGSKNILPLFSAASSGGLGGLDVESLLTTHQSEITNIILHHQGSVTFNADEGQGIKGVIGLVNAASNLIKSNGVFLNSQNGLVIQVHPRVKRRGGIGTFAFGVFASGFIGASLKVDPQYNQFIKDIPLPTPSVPGVPQGVGMGGGVNGPLYFRVGATSNSLTLTASSQQSFNNSSLFSPNAQHALALRALVLGSVPFGYAKGFNLKKAGKLSVGIDARYIYAMGYALSAKGSLNTIIDQGSQLVGELTSFNMNSIARQSTFGIDVGLAYRIKGVSVGLVGKYLNAPKINFNNGSSMRIDPQVRMGLGYRWKWLSLAWDLDLTSNQTMMLGKYSRMTGGGIMAHFKWFGLKFGAMGNIAKEGLHQGIILTGGIRLFKVLDISIQSSLQTASVGGIKLPNYMAVRLGGGWEW